MTLYLPYLCFGGWEGGGGPLIRGWALKIIFWGVGWALIRGWALINFSYLKGGRLFEVGAYSRLGSRSNKYGTSFANLARCLWNCKNGRSKTK